MSRIASPADALRCFREIDRADVELEKLHFPLEVEDCLAWTSGPRAFLLFCDAPTSRPRGIVFHRNSGAVPDVPAMCEWCYSVRAHGAVKLLSVNTDSRHHVGLWLCNDLGCLQRLRGVPGTDDIRESGDVEQLTRRVVARIASFAARRLG